MKHHLQLLCVCLLWTLQVSATTLTFDNEPNQLLLSNYGGLSWSGFEVVNGSLLGRGFSNGVVSASNVATDFGGQTAQFTSATPFNLDSAYLTGCFRDGLSVEVQGYVGASLAYDNTYIVNAAGPTLIDFNYLGIDEAKFIPSGGTLHPGFSAQGDNTPAFAMDNLTVSTPDGSVTGGLFGISCTGLMLPRKKFFA